MLLIKVVDLLTTRMEIGIFEGTQVTHIPNYAIINTTKGIITIELFAKSSRSVVTKFVARSQHGYFNHLHFYRVIKHIVIQGGDPELAGGRDDWTNGGELSSQLAFSPKHEAFMVGTTKSENKKENFELYITTAPIPDLNAKIDVFGHVIKGTDVVQEIEEVDTDEHFRPKSPVIINDISLKDEL
eukprot:TRINITY_DN2896_c0_g1_i6.p1 TRINITY_DN2896_c0_g1~~TRINITY_DN2896_c0_g1_i6.p1  ORF type:complete len:185 (-),score=33.90 TRINITY_DN2896_c0_g1_i6:454-1008(-)